MLNCTIFPKARIESSASKIDHSDHAEINNRVWKGTIIGNWTLQNIIAKEKKHKHSNAIHNEISPT